MSKYTDRMTKFFGYSVDNKNKSVKPYDKKIQSNDDIKTPLVKISPEIQRMWDWYVKENYDTRDTLKGRFDRYKDIDYIVCNDCLVSMAVEVYADEIAQVDDAFEFFKIRSKNPKVANEIKRLFNLWGVNQKYFREVAYELVKYGDSFDIISSNEKEGITNLTRISPYDIKERFEFKASEIEKKKNRFQNLYSQSTNIVNYMLKYAQSEKEDPSASYKEYLFGFLLGENHYMAPWQILHYRLMINGSEFYPFGRSLFVNIIGPWRMYRTALNFMGMARPMTFPKEVFKVHSSEEMTKAEKWDAVADARSQYNNIGKINRNRDQFALGEELWITDDIEHETMNLDFNLDDIGDVELLRDNVIAGTKLPKGILVTNESNWGTSAQAIFQQSKPIARTCASVQSCILERLVWLVKLHFAMTEQFEKENTEFEISVNFPVIEEASDRLNAKKDALDFAVSIIDNLKDTIGYNGDEMPAKLVKKVFSKFTFLSPEEIDDYVDLLVKARNKDLGVDDNSVDVNSEKIEESSLYHENENRINTRLTEEVASESYFHTLREKYLLDRISYGKHSVASLSNAIKSDDKLVIEMYMVDKYDKK